MINGKQKFKQLLFFLCFSLTFPIHARTGEDKLISWDEHVKMDFRSIKKHFPRLCVSVSLNVLKRAQHFSAQYEMWWWWKREERWRKRENWILRGRSWRCVKTRRKMTNGRLLWNNVKLICIFIYSFLLPDLNFVFTFSMSHHTQKWVWLDGWKHFSTLKMTEITIWC